MACSKQHPSSSAPARTEILWDTYGVPHIYGRTTDELFRAVGWAQMEAHGDLILRLYAQARGRAAEFLGEQLLDSDRRIHTLGIPELAQTWWQQQTPRERAVVESFVAGINDWAAKHKERVPAALAGVLPIVPTDQMAYTLWVIHYTFVLGEDDVEDKWARGSNAWAIAPKYSASGNAMLLANPHLPWGEFFTWFEMHLVGPGIDAYGASLVGRPLISIGFNQHLAWTHTVNTIDVADYYNLTIKTGGYVLDGKLTEFQKQTKTLKVRTQAGMRDEPLTVLRTAHGPVVRASFETYRALALRVAGLDRPHLTDQYLDMISARNLRELEAALARQQMPMFNVIAADRDGHILHLFNGTVPVRSGGKFEDYAGIVDGSRSDLIWTRTHAYAQLPRVVDPPSGWLQNANDPPWTTTFPAAIDPKRYPPYMAPQTMGLRPQRSARMLMEDRDKKISFDELVAYKHSTRMEAADRILPELLPIANARGSERAKRAAAVLEKWDRSADAQSRGAVLFRELAQQLRGLPQLWKAPWSAERPFETPAGLADPQAALLKLDQAAEAVEKKYGSLDIPWGDVFRLRVGGKDLPANGASGQLGVFRVTGYKPDPGGKTETAWVGDSFVAAVELGPRVRAKVLVTYGNSSREGSPHRGDQIELYAKKQLRDAWLTRAEIEAHLERREAF